MENQILNSLLIILSTCLFVALTFPLIKRIANHIGAIDIPNERKVHKKPIARLGGLGIFMGFLFGFMFFGRNTIQMTSILIGGFIILLTGLFDDIKPISAKTKLIGQILSAAVIVFYGDIILTNITVFGLDIKFGIFAYPLSIIFIVACENVINLIDGLDGLSGGTSSIFYLATLVLCLIQGRTGLEYTLATIMLGSTLGFLIHNFYPAKIFAGDSGALFMGFMIAVLALFGFKTTVVTSIFIPIMIIAVPVLDTLFAIIRRLINHKKITDPDKEHLHHQLLKKTNSQVKSVLLIYLINILFASASILYTLKDTKSIWLGRIIYIILFIVVIFFVQKTNIIFRHKDK